MASFQELFSYQSMMPLVNEVLGGVPPVLQAFLNRTTTVTGNSGKITLGRDTRVDADMVSYGSPPSREDQADYKQKEVTLMHSKRTMSWTGNDLLNLTSFSDVNRQRMGAEKVNADLRRFFQKQLNLKLSAVASMFSCGKLFFKRQSNGTIKLLGPSTTVIGSSVDDSEDASLTVDFEVPAGHINQTGATTWISGDWATSTTDILGDIAGIRRTVYEATGQWLNNCIYGKDVPAFISGNAKIQGLYSGNNVVQNSFLSGGVPSGMNFAEIQNWIPGYMLFHNTASDFSPTIERWVRDDQVILFPDPNVNWYQYVEGSDVAPTAIGVTGSADPGSFTEVFGDFAWGERVTKPQPAIEVTAGSTFLPYLVNGSAIAIGDVS